MKLEIAKFRSKLSTHGRQLYEYFTGNIKEEDEGDDPLLVIYDASMEVSRLIRELDELIEDLGLNK